MKTELFLDSSDQVHYFAEYCVKVILKFIIANAILISEATTVLVHVKPVKKCS